MELLAPITQPSMPHILSDFDAKLRGFPETTLTILLIIAGLVAWFVAIYGTPTLKAVLLAWMIAP
jgi:hypothetical protein